MEGNRLADDYALGWSEEAGDDADCGEHHIVVPDLIGEEQPNTKEAANDVTGDQGTLQGPAVDEDTGKDAENGDGYLIGDLNAGNLLRVGLEFECENADDGEESKKVSEVGDNLRIPKPAHCRDAQHLAHGHGGWWRRLAGRCRSDDLWLCG